jgi:hypothetical protein
MAATKITMSSPNALKGKERLIVRMVAAGMLVLLATSPSAWAERTITSLPFTLNFDDNNYSDLLWLSSGATQTWMPNSGWRGGAAKITPPNVEGYAGLGQFHLNGLSVIPEQINVRFLVYYGPTWWEYGPGGKLIIINRDGNRGRPMVIIRDGPLAGQNWETWGACDGTVCKYEGGDFWPDGRDRLRIGDRPAGREGEWISFELEANTRTGMIRLYVDTQDGALSGLYVERYMSDTGPGGTWSYIDIIGGYMWAAVRQDPGNYFMFDELVIDSKRIGPPAGFTSSVAPRPPTDVGAE